MTVLSLRTLACAFRLGLQQTFFLCFALAGWTACAVAQSQAGSAAAPAVGPLTANTITIAKGGTYTGNWISTDPGVPAVTVLTDDPVTIENSTVMGRGNLIVATGSAGANLTVRNVSGQGLDPLVAGQQRGAFLVAYIMNSLTVQNCTMTGTSFGVKTGFSTASHLSILNNLATNLEDRASDGNGGFQSVRTQLGHFALLYQVSASSGAEIGWNQIVQTMGQSSIDDVITVYKSQGSANNPINVHDNYMEGHSSPSIAAYTASGISSTGDNTSVVSAFATFKNNQVIHTAGNGISVLNGHDITADGNRIVSCGQDTTGAWFSRAGVAAVTLWNRAGSPGYTDNTIVNTAGGLVIPNTINRPVASDSVTNPADLLNPTNSVSGNSFTDPCLAGGSVNLAAEDSERSRWSAKLTASAQTVGDQHSPVQIAVFPSSVSLGPSVSQQFASSVSWTSNTAVTWSMSPVLGTLSANGLYNAPSGLSASQTITITATSIADTSKTASSSMQLIAPVQVAVIPGNSTITSAQTQRFTANVTNTVNTGVAWSISPSIGNISSAGVYSPPSLLTNPQTITITATSLADATKSASTMLAVTPAAIAMTPSSISLAGGSSQQFTAMLQNGLAGNVLWSIAPSIGTITSSGLYTAPASIASVQSITITAANAANTNQWVTGTITLLPPVKINLLSSYATLTASQTVLFTAAVQNTSNIAVHWTITPAIGSISTTGLYTAPTIITSQQTITYSATSVADPSKSATGSIVLTPPVNVAVVPSIGTLAPSAVLQFAGNVAWSKNTAVTWTISPALGNITANGLYTAPSSTTTPQQVTITATSVADPTKSSNAAITLNPPVSLMVTPANATTTLGQTQLFNAAVSYTSNPAVNWSLSPSVGSISASGRYTPPATPLALPQVVTITANSVDDPTKSASASIIVNPPSSVSVSPGMVSLAALQTQQFTPKTQYAASNSVLWSLSPVIGAINASGLYTAPASITSVQTVTLTATLVSDPSKSTNVTVTLLPPVKVNLVSAYAAISAAQTAQFSALVQNTSNTAVQWSINPAAGSISTSGVYTAPTTVTAQQAVTITATSVADPTKAVSGTVIVNPPVSISISPQNATLSPGVSQQFAGNVAWSNNTGVAWSISPAIGSVSANGMYTAPSAITTPQTIAITASSVADPSKSSSASITLNPPPFLVVAPGTATVTPGQTQLFAASVLYTTNTAVTWSINPGLGTISASGRYTPPSGPVSSPQTVAVTATSVSDPTRSATAVITVNPPVNVLIVSGSGSLAASQKQQLSAMVQWATNSNVIWTITPALGTISQSGLYTAPAVISAVQQVTVTAISSADPSKYATTTLTLLPPVKINLLSNYAVVSPGQTANFQAQVQNSSNVQVTWSISPAFGSISGIGIYTPPAVVTAQQTVTVTATSLADASKTAVGTVLVNPAVSVTIAPGNTTLTASHSQQLSAYVAWNPNTSVTWSMSPSLGTLSNSGVYTAPTSVTQDQTVAITATSVVDSTKSATIYVTLKSLIGPAPIVITEGGTYSGNWVSNDPNTPAITVSTDAPVVIQNSTVQASGNLIQIAGVTGANVTIQNVTGIGLNPNVAGRQRGAFVRASVVNTLNVANCTMSGTSFGIQISSSVASALSIIGNQGINLEDRASDGAGGLQTSRPQLGHFILLSNVTAPNGAEIAWNELKQTIGQSSTEDVINIYYSQGAASRPIFVHDNYMEGYSSSTTPVYTGNGLISDGDSMNVSAYILFQNNEMVHTAGGGVAIASGHDVAAVGNRVVSCGSDAAGDWYSRPGTAAVALWNYYNSKQYYNNSIITTGGGLVAPSASGSPVASDVFVNASDALTNNNSVGGNVFTDPCLKNDVLNISAEDNERSLWQKKLNENSVMLGDQH